MSRANKTFRLRTVAGGSVYVRYPDIRALCRDIMNGLIVEATDEHPEEESEYTTPSFYINLAHVLSFKEDSLS